MPRIKTKLILQFCFILLTTMTVSCQKNKTPSLVKIKSLPETLHEVSGVTMLSNNQLYAINDSGNDNTLFCLNLNGKVINKVKIPGVKNIDWEDITYDPQDNIYIGDFGNNSNHRKDLVIYKVSGVLSDSIAVSKIEFIFEDQKKFPPNKKNFNFDVEAFIHLDNNLYLFTKDRSKNEFRTTKLYKISASPGIHMAKLIGTYETCKDRSDCLITAAAVNRSQDKIALLTHNKIFLLSNFKGDSLFDGEIRKIKLHHYSQKEGISFKNDTTLFITDEKTKHKKAMLYKYTLDQ